MKIQTKLNTLTRSLIVAGVVAAVSLPAVAKNYRNSSNGYYDNHSSSHYGSSNSAYDYAKVVNVNPVVETYQVNNPVEKCWDERVPVRKSHYSKRRYDSKTPEIFGAIIGAAVGNRLGKKGGGKARDVATVAGAVLGGSVARDVKHKNRARRDHYNDRYNDRYERARYKTVKQCELHDSYTTKEQVVGYDVAYKYRGNVFHTQMDQHPGDKIKVKITVDPV